MPLSPSTRPGPYEVTAQIGAGGMGEVYRAHDTKLNRDVAIKVLPEVFAGDPERLSRFTREAQTLASLNHPNIAAIYGIEDPSTSSGTDAGSGSGVRALVMELVEGEDLSAHIARGPIPIAEALPIAKQIAEALEAARARHHPSRPQAREHQSTPQALFGGIPSSGSTPFLTYQPSKDGQRFLVSLMDPESRSPITVVLNWQKKIRR